MGNKLKAISKVSVALALLGAAVPAVEAAPTVMAAKKATKKAKKSTKKVVKKNTKKAKKAKKTTKKKATKKVAKKTAAKKPAKKSVKKPVAKKPAKKVVKKTTTKKPAKKFVKHVTMADKYQPKVKSSTVNIDWGTDFYDSDNDYINYSPVDFITNKSSLPSGVYFYYLDYVDTSKSGTYKTRILAHYDDGSEEVVGTVTFVVQKSDAEKYPPTVKDVTLNWGDSFGLRKDAITNALGYFPKNTKFSYDIDGYDEDGYDDDDRYFTYKSGTYNAHLSVEYPDGSSEMTKEFKITVLPSDAETYKAKLSLKSSNFTVLSNETLEHKTDNGDYTLNDPTRFLNIDSALPKGTTFSFDADSGLDSVYTPAPGKHETSLTIYFPDGSEFQTDKFTVNVKTDAETYKAKVSLKSSNFTVLSNETLEHKTDNGDYTLNDPTRFLNIDSALPKGTTFSFDADSGLDSVYTPAPGKHETSLTIYFPDGSEFQTDKFTVNVKTDAETYKAKVSLKSSNFTVLSNETLEHEIDSWPYKTLNDPTRFLNIGSALPKGTVFVFDDSDLNSVDTPAPGKYETSLTVRFPDGSIYQTDKFTLDVK